MFAGSFDPFTVGHRFVVQRALELFDGVVVGVGVNSSKGCFLEPERRVALIGDVFRDEPRVSVGAYEGLTGEFALSVGARFLVRGARTGSDFEYERGLSEVNSLLFPGLQTVIIPAVSSVSSSVVREVFRAGGDLSALMPEGIDLKHYFKKS